MEGSLTRIRSDQVLPDGLVLGERHETLRNEIRAWLREHRPDPPPPEYQAKLQALIRWQSSLASAGFMGLSWPARYGGRGMDLAAEAVLADELASTPMPQIINRLALYTWGPTILDWGTEQQKTRFLPGMLDASEIWCQGFSEPDAGSDLAAVRTMARPDGDDLIVNGQKVWTSRAEVSRWNAMLVRSEAGSERHRGLTLIIVDMNSPGITVRPLMQMLNEPHFSEVYFDDVRVPQENVLGGPGNGWAVAMAAMGYERGLFVLERQISLRGRLEELRSLLAKRGLSDRASPDLDRLAAGLELLRAQVYRTLAGQITGTLPAGSTSVDKLFLADVYQDLYRVAFRFLGVDSAFAADSWTHDLLESRSVSIYSGTSEIQRNIIAARLLGIRP